LPPLLPLQLSLLDRSSSALSLSHSSTHKTVIPPALSAAEGTGAARFSLSRRLVARQAFLHPVIPTGATAPSAVAQWRDRGTHRPLQALLFTLSLSSLLFFLCALSVLCGEIISFCCWLSPNGYWLAPPALSASSLFFFRSTTTLDTAIPTKYNPTIGIMKTSIVPASGVGVMIAATTEITRIA